MIGSGLPADFVVSEPMPETWLTCLLAGYPGEETPNHLGGQHGNHHTLFSSSADFIVIPLPYPTWSKLAWYVWVSALPATVPRRWSRPLPWTIGGRYVGLCGRGCVPIRNSSPSHKPMHSGALFHTCFPPRGLFSLPTLRSFHVAFLSPPLRRRRPSHHLSLCHSFLRCRVCCVVIVITE